MGLQFVPPLTDGELADLLRGFAVINGAETGNPEIAKIRLLHHYYNRRADLHLHRAALFACGEYLHRLYPAAPRLWDHYPTLAEV